jgi:hypothetical protein
MKILVRTFIAVGCLSILALIVTNNAELRAQVGRSGEVRQGRGCPEEKNLPTSWEHRHEY